jgi:peptide deformylase
MTRKDLIVIPHPMLRQKSQRVGFIDEEIRRLAQQMVEVTLDWEDSRKHETGAALAAVQIAKPIRLVVIRNDFEDKNNRDFTVFINPEIVKTEGEPTEELEGCLSVTSLYGNVARYPKVKVKAKNLDGQEVRVTATGFLARVFQHEIDHTNGIVFVDRVSDPEKLLKLQPDGSFAKVSADDV